MIDLSKSVKAFSDFERQMRVVALYMPMSAPWPLQSWFSRKMNPTWAELTMDFAKIELSSDGIYLDLQGNR